MERTMLLVMLLALGCTGIPTPPSPDAGMPGDVGPPLTYERACGRLFNTWDTYCHGQPFTAELCPYAPGASVPAADVEACNQQIYEARASCAAMAAAIEACP